MRCSAQVVRVQRLEADEQAAQAGVRRPLEQVRRAGSAFTVPAACNSRPIPRMPSNSAVANRAVAEQVVVEEVEVPAGQPLDLRERVVDRLRVERPAALEERVLVAEVAVVRAAARDDDRVRAPGSAGA